MPTEPLNVPAISFPGLDSSMLRRLSSAPVAMDSARLSGIYASKSLRLILLTSTFPFTFNGEGRIDPVALTLPVLP